MSDASTRWMIKKYVERAGSPLFLSSFFQTPQRNFHYSEEVEIDVERDKADIALVIADPSIGPRLNESSMYTNKQFKPPVLDEAGVITAYNLLKRQAGESPYDNVAPDKKALSQAFDIFQKLEAKIRRTVELMCAQILQTGAISFTDANGNVLYSLDFSMKASHNSTGTPWSTTSAPALAQISGLAQKIRTHSHRRPDTLLFGKVAWQEFLKLTEVTAYFAENKAKLGEIEPRVARDGASFRGKIWIDHYEYEMWMYDGFYEDPANPGQVLPYIDDEKVVIMSSGARMDITYGAIPILQRDPRAMAFLPDRIESTEAGLAMTVNAWFEPGGKTLKLSAGTRPLAIPTAIDSFAVVST